LESSRDIAQSHENGMMNFDKAWKERTKELDVSILALQKGKFLRRQVSQM
jgi:hypothetical protein